MLEDNVKRLRMEKRERILAAIEFRHPDRMPIRGECGSKAALSAITGRNDFGENPKEVYAEANRKWDIDLIHQFVLPDRLDRTCGPHGELDLSVLMTCIHGMIAHWKEKHSEKTFSSPEEFRDFCDQIPDASEASQYVDRKKVREKWIELDAWGDFLAPSVWIPGHLAGTCNWMFYTSVGYEPYLMAHLLYPESVNRLFAFAGEEGKIKNEVIASVIKDNKMIPLLYSGEDICDNRGPLCSPEILKQIYFPHLKNAISPIVEQGIHWMWHSDGNIIPILDNLLDCGIDGFQGFEEDKNMDLSKLIFRKCRNGKYPFICGSVSVSTTMYQTTAAVASEKERMKRLFDERGGGVILGSSSTIMADTPVENILELYKKI